MISTNDSGNKFPSREQIAKTLRYAFTLLGQIALIIIILHLYDLCYKDKVGVINVTSIINEFINTQQNQKLSPLEQKVQLQTFTFNLDKIIKGVSKQKNLMLFTSESVIAGAKDYTKLVQSQLTTIYPRKVNMTPLPQPADKA